MTSQEVSWRKASSTQTFFFLTFSEQYPTCQIWCSHDLRVMKIHMVREFWDTLYNNFTSFWAIVVQMKRRSLTN